MLDAVASPAVARLEAHAAAASALGVFGRRVFAVELANDYVEPLLSARVAASALHAVLEYERTRAALARSSAPEAALPRVLADACGAATSRGCAVLRALRASLAAGGRNFGGASYMSDAFPAVAGALAAAAACRSAGCGEAFRSLAGAALPEAAAALAHPMLLGVLRECASDPRACPWEPFRSAIVWCSFAE